MAGQLACGRVLKGNLVLEQKKLVVSSHSISGLLAHFVWATKGRLPFITPAIERRVYRYIAGICRRNGCSLVALGGTENHVHLLVYLGAQITQADLVNEVKGASSRFASELLGTEGVFAWQRGYAVFGVSPQHKERVQRYIQKQKEHHDSGELWPGVESFDEPDEESTV